jgi:DNA-binding response OmpR family regulator
MVVDDEPMVRRFVSTILSGSGYDVVDADSPEQAVLMMESHRDIDLLVTDVVMPNVNGRELASQLTKRQPGLRVLFMSGCESGSMQGASFLQEPFRIPELLARVREILA